MPPEAGCPGPIVVHVVGDVMVDVVVQVQAAFSHASDTPSAITTAPGGSGANQAMAMSSSGAAVTLLGVVGDDPFGDASALALHDAGVDVSLLGRSPSTTGVVVALVEPDGQRSMLTDRGANLSLDVAMVERLDAVLAEGHHVHVSGYCLLGARTRPAGRHALELAVRHKATSSVDASSSGPLRSVGADQFLAWVRGVDYLFCNEEEARVLTGEAVPSEMALALRSGAGAGEVIVTLGASGAVVATRGGELHLAPAEPAAVADTIGAGDSFTANYLVGRLRGSSPEDALDAALAAARDAVGRRGARDWAARYSR